MLFALFALGACTSSTSSPSDSTGAGDDTAEPGDDPAEPVAEPVVCDTPAVDLDGADTTWTVSTDHYTLTVDGFDEDEARTLGLLAELGRTGMASFFGADGEGPFEAIVTADEPSFQAALAADGITGITDAGGWYDPNTRRAYLFRQPTAYYSRVLFLHELVHQYQDAVGETSGAPGWYVEGLAEALSRHHLDGDCLQLRVTPLLSWEDLAAQAQTELGAGTPDLDAVFAGGAASRALSYALVRLLSTDPTYATGFAGWRADVAAGAVSPTDEASLEAATAPAETLTDALLAFVPTQQEPMSPVWLDWLPEASDAASGWADASGAARVKGEVTTFSMTVTAPAAYVGSVYGYDEATGDLELALLGADGSVSRFAVAGGVVAWDVYGSVTTSGDVDWTQVAGDGTTDVVVGGTTVSLPRSFAPAGGLAVYYDAADFRDLRWTAD